MCFYIICYIHCSRCKAAASLVLNYRRIYCNFCLIRTIVCISIVISPIRIHMRCYDLYDSTVSIRICYCRKYDRKDAYRYRNSDQQTAVFFHDLFHVILLTTQTVKKCLYHLFKISGIYTICHGKCYDGYRSGLYASSKFFYNLFHFIHHP